MAIGINSVGNYGFSANRINRTNSVAKKSNVNATAKTVATKKPTEKSILSENERKFFSEMYPDKKNIVMDYHFYQRSGKMDGVAVGSIINRRG